MPDPSTTRLALYKSKSDGSELVNYPNDLGGNWDKVDLAVGFQPATSTTRPSTPYSGKPILETDTGYRTYFSNGTAPASASWVEIPNSSAVYQGRFVTLFPGSTAGSSLMRLAQSGAAAGSRAFAARGSGDTADRFFFDFDGKIQWGPGGAAAGDTNLYRASAGLLTTDGALTVGGALTASGALSVVGDLTVQGKDRGRGIRSSIARTAPVTFGATETVIMATPSFTWVNGRAYRVTVWGYINAPASNYALFRIRKGATNTGTIYVDGVRISSLNGSSTGDTSVNLSLVLVNTSGIDIATAVCLTGNQGTTAQTWTWDASTTTLASYFTVEDVGLAADWAGSPIS